MNFDGAFAQTQFASDHFIGQSVTDQDYDLMLAIGQHGQINLRLVPHY